MNCEKNIFSRTHCMSSMKEISKILYSISRFFKTDKIKVRSFNDRQKMKRKKLLLLNLRQYFESLTKVGGRIHMQDLVVKFAKTLWCKD